MMYFIGRHCFLLLTAVQFIFFVASGQTNIPTAATAPPTATPIKVPYFSHDPSPYYLRTLVPMKPTTDSSQVNINALVEEISVTTQYRDALSRPVQTVIRQASPLKKDYVVPVYYDEFGNVSTGYLPYVQQTDNTNDGKFKDNALLSDSAFYKSFFPDEQIYYSRQILDGSPLQQITKVTAEGNSWTGANRGISYGRRANTVADSVRLWVVNIVGEDDVPSTTLRYQAASLLVQETTDEKGIKSVSYTDELGRTVMTKTQLAASPSTGHKGWLCTYYVYDEMGQLRMVIPPKAVEALNPTAINWNLSGNIAIRNGLCYYYWYDSRGRAIMKYIPGKGKFYSAYDLFDRAVMTQDEKLRIPPSGGGGAQWAFVKYDGQSRPIKSGLITSALIKDTIFAQASRSTDYPVVSGTYTITSEAYYDDYSWIAATGAPVTSTFESANINGTNFNTNYNTAPEYAQTLTASNRIRGTLTGVKKIIVGTANYLYSVNIYDHYRMVIQSKQTNYTSGTDVTTVQYGYAGQVLRTHVQHQKSGTNAQTHTLLTKYTYDHVGRVKTIVKNIDNLGDKTITQNTFNELGQLQAKSIGTNVESQNFEYNIRGWLTAINKNYITTTGSTSNFFGEALSYDYGFTNNQYNGAVAGAKWKAAGDGIARAYGFTYDNTNRLTIAEFSQQSSALWKNDSVDFTVNGLNYDAGSNILAMKQRGLKIGSSATIDSLTYQYFANSNQLQKVADGINDNSPLGDFKDTALATDDYLYDVNGNITKDNNRHMHTTANGNGAVYNVLDKPDSMVMAGKATLYYYYDASGGKLRKKVNDYASGSLVVKDYLFINGFVYLNDTLQYVLQEEGRIRYARKKNSTTGAIYYAFEYEYFIRDHLGNVRTVLTEGRDTSTYAATMESADSVIVRALFSNVYDPVNTVSPKPGGFDTDGANQKVSKLNGNGNKTGPSLVLKVMAGDKVQISTYAFYNTAVQPPPGGIDLTSDILSLLSTGVVNNSGGKITNAAGVSAAVNPGVTNFLNNNRPYDNAKPKAYLNWILFDNQFNYIASNSGVKQAQPGASKQALVAPLQTIARNGYLYIYLSNESQQDVYFDDLNVKHYTGPLVQEQSYYPFGLQMAGISDKALNKLSSQNKFNGGVEIEEEFGVNLYSTFFRQYDPQLGRFNGVDILGEVTYELNPYQFAGNNPLIFNDPTGALMETGTGRMQRGNDGNYHVPWLNELTDNSVFLPWNDASSGGGASAVNDGYRFTGDASKAVLQAILNAYNNPDADGNWSFAVDKNKRGDIGYWTSYNFSVDNGNGNTIGQVFATSTFVRLNGGNERNSAENSFVVKATLCGPYNWKEVGNAYVAKIEGLFVYASAIKAGWGSIRFDLSNVCVTLPKYELDSPRAATNVFNAAWNAAAVELDIALNTWPASAPLLKTPSNDACKTFFLTAIRLNLEAFNSGSSFSYPNNCPGVTTSFARYCQIGK
jgi:RHS repeat-associated protein